jgi:nitrilase
MDTLPRIKVAAVQASSALLDRDRGAEKTCRLLEKAADLGVQVAVFPECFVPGYPIWLDVHQATSPQAIRLYKALFAASVEIPGPAVARIAEAARKTNIVVVLGVCERRANTTGSLFNSLVFIDGHGRIVGVHRKLVPTLLERLVHAPGHGEMLNVYQTEFGRIGGLICGENSNHLAKFHLMSQGQTIHAAAWPPFFFTKPMSQVIDFVSRAAAYENKVFVINSAGVLDDENLERVRAGETGLPSDLAASSGGSSIVAPTGDMLAGPLVGEEGILSCEIDLQDVVAQKMIHDFAGHYNRSDVFSFSVKKHVGSLGEPEREPQETNSGAAESEGETPA